jgi:ATP/maltotriose-dependent transcriptional regulator MalT
MVPSYRCALALAALRAGRSDEAGRLLGALAASEGEGALDPRDPNHALNLALLAEVAAGARDAAAAERLHAALAPRRGRYLHVPNLLAVGCASHWLGLLEALRGEGDRALASFEEALAVEERMAARPRVAAVHAEIARCLRARGAPGDRDAARRHEASAQRVARGCGIALR